MQTYLTGPVIRRLREARGLTQAQLAAQLFVSDKTVSKWETAKVLPDISLVEPLAAALGVSVMELMSGAPVVNRNVAANLLRARFRVCPVCGNILHATGDAVLSCCGIALPALEAEPDTDGILSVAPVEDEVCVTAHHSMEKSHYLSFLAYETADALHLVKLYPEGSAEARRAVCVLQPSRIDWRSDCAVTQKSARLPLKMGVGRIFCCGQGRMISTVSFW